MTAVTIDLKNADDTRDIVHRAVEAISAGKIVALPTETVYGLAVSALNPAAVERLSIVKDRTEDKPFTVAIRGHDEALDYVPGLCDLGRRFAQRCWPGPVTLVLDGSHRDSVLHRLDPAVRQAINPAGTVGLRVPAHELTLQILRLCAGPVLLTSANRGGQSPATSGEGIADAVGDGVDVVLNDGATHFSAPSSVVKVHDNEFSMLREGVVNETSLRRAAGFVALIVCTGNTCRSPMGEGILRQLIAERIGCPSDQIEPHGATVLSAGITAMSGGAAASPAIEVMGEADIDLRTHSSQPISAKMIRYADVILTMTNGHRQALLARWPGLENRTFTLRRDKGDIDDPIGGPVELYRMCSQEIRKNLIDWMDDFKLPTTTD